VAEAAEGLEGRGVAAPLAPTRWAAPNSLRAGGATRQDAPYPPPLVEAFTAGLAHEGVESGTQVDCGAPGTTYTGIHAAASDPTRLDRVAERMPLGRAADPRETAESVLRLLSSHASYVAGADLRASSSHYRATEGIV
jgi:hypothetical protein